MKKLTGLLLSGTALLSAMEVDINPFGYLTAGYNQRNDFTLSARSGATFGFGSSGFSVGLGAIGAWNIPLDARSSASVGDISDAYVKYKKGAREDDGSQKAHIEASLGRFNSDYLTLPWVAGNVQGLGVAYSITNRFDIYALYANSYLNTGYKRGQIGAVYGSALGSLVPYSPDSKNSSVGGEVITGGVRFSNQNILFDVFGLLNTKFPSGSNLGSVAVWNSANALTYTGASLLWQAGAVASFDIGSQNVRFQTNLKGLAQYGNTDQRDVPDALGQDFSVLAWADERITLYEDFHIGVGAHYVFGREGTGGIWSISDTTRYYGNTLGRIGNSALLAPYFYNNLLSAYLYGDVDIKNFKLQAMASFIDYQEISLMLQYSAWQQDNMKLDFGGGFIYHKYKSYGFYNTTASRDYTWRRGSSFNVFVRFTY